MSSNSLAALQSWLQLAIQQPELTESTVVSETIRNNSGASPTRRLAIYQNGYTLRLLECLRSEYPILISAFSAQWFDLMAQHYLNTHPSSSTNLNDLSASFPAFLGDDRPDKNLVEKDRAYDFVIGVAEFERAKLEVSRGKGAENSDHENFMLFESTNLESLSVCLADNVRLIDVPFQLLEFLDNNQMEPKSVSNSKQKIIISRSQYKLNYFEVSDWQYELVSTLRRVKNLGVALEFVSKQYLDKPVLALAPFYLSYLASKGAISRVSLV